MSVLLVVLPLALLASGAAVVAFIWASRSGQLDDLTTPALRAIEDDDAPRTSASSSSIQENGVSD